MAHTCPNCDATCHCHGDIDDINFGERLDCEHCDEFEDEDWDDEDFEEDDDEP